MLIVKLGSSYHRGYERDTLVSGVWAIIDVLSGFRQTTVVVIGQRF